MPYHPDSIEAQLLAGDPRAVGSVMRWIAVVLSTPRFRVLRPEWLDLHQESLLRILISLKKGRFDPSLDFRKYAQGVARLTAVQRLSQPRTEVPLEEAHEAAGQTGPRVDEAVATTDLASRALEEASEACRSLLQAYFYAQMSYEEIAAAQAIPVGTVKSRLVRCLDRLHRAMSAARPRLPRGSVGDRRVDPVKP